MPNCQQCGVNFHACPSCSLSKDWESKYCTPACWEISAERRDYESQAQDFVGSLKPMQREWLKKVFNEWQSDAMEILEDRLNQDD